MSKTIFLHPSLIVTIIIAGLAFALANALNLESNIASIASSVFSVAGTMVALALQAADLHSYWPEH